MSFLNPPKAIDRPYTPISSNVLSVSSHRSFASTGSLAILFIPVFLVGGVIYAARYLRGSARTSGAAAAKTVPYAAIIGSVKNRPTIQCASAERKPVPRVASHFFAPSVGAE